MSETTTAPPANGAVHDIAAHDVTAHDVTAANGRSTGDTAAG